MTAPTQPQVASRRPSAAQIATLIALVEAQAHLRGLLTTAAQKAAADAFSAITDWWDGHQIDKAVTATLKIVRAQQIQAARITDAYLARSASAMTGRRVAPAGAIDLAGLRREITAEVAKDIVDGRREPAYVVLGEHDPDHRRVVPDKGMTAPADMVIPDPKASVADRVRARQAARAAGQTTPAAKAVAAGDPYGRVADGYRYDVVAGGATEDDARRKALVRVEAVAATDVTIAVREQVRKTLGKINDIRGYRRVLRPELSQSGPCGLCVVAATRVYKTGDLLPIHGRCVCETLPIIGELDPGLFLNQSDLDKIYNAAGSTGGGKRQGGALKKIRVALVENGELGPVLVDADQRYRGPKQVAPLKVLDKRTRLETQLKAYDESYPKLLRRREAGENVDRPIAFQEKRMDELRHELAAL